MDEQHRKNIIPIDLNKEMKHSFISYAMAVIINRALPDVRDGLKPVHRRILHGMSELSLWPDKPFRKSARIVGDVMGKYHPHGDSSIYDAMVRMAQPFSIRYPLVKGQGNFGSVDGDSAAAMRYTEAKFSPLAVEMLRDIGKETVDFMPNFDGREMQPTVLPARFPNLLVNGAGGIAVGMATNIPPHNLCETIDAVVAQIKNPEISLGELMQHMPGPDFPTGGNIMGTLGITDAYRTGRGRIIVRGVAEIEAIDNSRSRIVITEIPYQVNKARLVEKIGELVNQKKLEGVSHLRDESDRKGMRIVVELKRDVNAQIVLNYLYKHTQLQDTFGVIMLVLVDNEPKVLSLKQVIHYYIQHQREVILRRTRYDLDKAQARAHILEGLLVALDNIDEVVRIIRASQTAAIARDNLMQRFAFSEKQAQAILDMRLQRLTGLERDKLQAEYQELEKTIAYLQSILADPQLVDDIICQELLDIKAKFGDARRTQILHVAEEINLEDIIQEEDMVITLTHFGYIKRLTVDTYRSQHRGGRGVTALQTREEDYVEKVLVTSTHNHLLFFTNFGRVYRVKCYEVPQASRQSKGTAIVNMLPLQGGEKVTEVLPVADTQKFLIMATRRGIIKKTLMSDFDNIMKNGKIAINLAEDDELIRVIMTGGDDEILLGSQKGKALRFHESHLRPMGRNATGVRGMRLLEDDKLVDMELVQPDKQVLAVTAYGQGKRSRIEEYRQTNRGTQGIFTMKLTDASGDLVCQKMVDASDELMLVTEGGVIIRTPVSDISIIGRNTKGVRVMRVEEGNPVVSCAVFPAEEGDKSHPADVTAAPDDLDFASQEEVTSEEETNLALAEDAAPEQE